MPSNPNALIYNLIIHPFSSNIGYNLFDVRIENLSDHYFHFIVFSYFFFKYICIIYMYYLYVYLDYIHDCV